MWYVCRAVPTCAPAALLDRTLGGCTKRGDMSCTHTRRIRFVPWQRADFAKLVGEVRLGDGRKCYGCK